MAKYLSILRIISLKLVPLLTGCAATFLNPAGVQTYMYILWAYLMMLRSSRYISTRVNLIASAMS